MANEVKPVDVTEVNETVVDQTTENVNDGTPPVEEKKSHSDIVKYCISMGSTLIRDVQIKNVTYSVEDNYTRICLTLNQKVPGYVNNPETNEFEKASVNTIFVSAYALVGVIKENEDTAFLANKMVESVSSMQLILSGSRINILQTQVTAGELYTNPFSTREATADPRDYDRIFNNVTKITLGKVGQKAAEMVMMKMLE